MSLRSNGSYIGPRPDGPSSSVASGIWDLRTAERQRRAAAWPIPAEPDPDFASVSLLLHMEGSNGSATFTDSGPSTLTGTASGATISTTQAKFGLASGAFNLSSNDQHVRFPHSSGFTFSASDKFVIELWYYPTSFGSYNYLVSKGDDSGGTQRREWAVGVRASSMVFYRFSGSDISYSPPATISLNTWTHLAWACDGSTVRLYQDGTLKGSTAWGAPSGNGTDRDLWIGKFLNYTGIAHDARGYIDELRITKGSDRGYTGSTITVPTAAFPDA